MTALAFLGGMVAGVLCLFGAAVIADRVDQRRVARRIAAAREANQFKASQVRQPIQRVSIGPARDDFDFNAETR